MKIRNGFVSNSSSSSFILMFDAVPGSVEEMEALMPDPEYPLENPKFELSKTILAKRVFDKIKVFENLAYYRKIKLLLEEFECRAYEEHEGYRDYDPSSGLEGLTYYDKVDKEIEEMADKMLNAASDIYGLENMFVVTFTDHDQVEAHLENGYYFKNIDYKMSNNH